jgi:outer membrane protein assembly factor BamA
MIGAIDGRAPVLDRFVLGNTQTLRGWNRYEIAPLGADRVIHFSADGRYSFVRAVYDTGTIWTAGRPKVLRHSAGLGFVISGITAMVAIPIRSSSIEPIFLVGMNF